MLALALLLAACTGGSEQVAAATVGDTQITAAAVDAAYGERTEAPAVAGALPQSEGAVDEDLQRDVLTNLIRREILRLAADDRGVDVTDEDLAAERDALVEQLGGQAALDELLEANGISEEQLRGELRDQAIQTKIGAQLADGEGNQSLGEYLTGFVDDLTIDVDEQYGRWDEGSISVVSSARPETPALPGAPSE